MLAAVKGVVKGNTIVVNEDILGYDGTEVIVTFLEYADIKEKKQRKPIDWNSFRMPSDRGNNVDKYMKEMRENDRM